MWRSRWTCNFKQSENTDIGGDAFNDWMNLAGRLNQSDRWRDATASLASIFLQIRGTIKSVVTTGLIMRTCCGTLIRPFNCINFTQPIDCRCYKTGFLKTGYSSSPKRPLLEVIWLQWWRLKTLKWLRSKRGSEIDSLYWAWWYWCPLSPGKEWFLQKVASVSL